MRPPEFWRADVGGRDSALMLRAMLTPLAWAYEWVAAQRIRAGIARHAPVPVVCVGNLTLGGAGKTPIARAIRAKLGPGAHTLSRGYGGRLAGPLRVTPDMGAREVGDEPLVHAIDGPAWISRDRLAGALAAAQAGARAIVMDDGFQNPELAKDVSIIAVDPEYGVGNGQVFPAGPLRERLSDGLARAHAIVMLGPVSETPHWLERFHGPILSARLEPAAGLPHARLLAFAGLARPEKFFETLAGLGAELVETVPFGDHHLYSEDDLGMLAQMADENGAMLITTEKDAARLSPDWRARVSVLPVTVRFEDDAAIDALLEPIRSRMNAAHG
jgi:tetraacyldisaccharide 4'-kinase